LGISAVGVVVAEGAARPDDLKAGLNYYSNHRPHSAFGHKTPTSRLTATD
jgi:hypothetical protein